MTRIRAHRATVWELQARLGERRTPISRTQKVRACTYARWVEALWWNRAKALARLAAYRILPNPRDWSVAVDVAQRVYPGTRTWLLGCSGAEGGHGSWWWFGRHPWRGYHIGNDYLGADTVGGWMQFRFSTFDPNSRAAFADVRARGFRLPRFVTPLGGPDRYAAWLSPLGQALVAGWMRSTGRDGSHWSASWGRGC